jgi:16S rRNA (adenine1518-N6/adenine1519-N6)-dimethyltransferase
MNLMKLYTTSSIHDIEQQFGFRLSKSLGQNFLIDKNIRDKIVEGSLIGPDDLVIEIGPGVGVLTQLLAEHAQQVIAIEIDKALIPILKETLEDYPNTKVVNEDVLRCDLNSLIAAHQPKGAVRFVGNLPYYITTPIIMKILEDRIPADSITVMVQKEVADRLSATPGNKTYGAITVAVRYYCTVTKVISAPREVFYPRPNVDSTVIRLDIRKECPVKLLDEAAFFAVVKAGFGQRRKTLHNALTGIYGLDKLQTGSIIEKAGIDPGRRAETLDMDEFARLANTIVKEVKE